MKDTLITTQEAADQLGFNASRIRQLLLKGELKGERIPPEDRYRGIWYVSKSSVDNYSKKRKQAKSVVYFALCLDSKLIKIGYSKRPTGRMQGLSSHTKTSVVFLCSVVGGKRMERILHTKFVELRAVHPYDVSGVEWFYPQTELVAYIQSADVVDKNLEIDLLLNEFI